MRRKCDGECSHLRVKDGGRSLNNRDSLVENLSGVDVASGALDHSGEVEVKVLGMHLGCEAVGHRLALTGGNGEVVAGGTQVTESNWWIRSTWEVSWSQEGTTNEQEFDRLDLVVCDRDDGLSSMTVDQLHTEDLTVGEGTLDIYVKLGRDAGVLEFLFNLIEGLAL